VRAAAAIAWIQFRMLVNSMTRQGTGWSAFGGILLFALAAVLSLGLALGLGVLCLAARQKGDDDLLQIAFLAAFWIASVFGLLMPLLLSSGGCGLDVSSLRLYPLSRAKLFWIRLGASFVSGDHGFYYPGLLAVFVLGVVPAGRGVGLGALFCALLVVVIVTWSQALANGLQGIMRKRRTREVLGLVGLLCLFAVIFAPALLGTLYDDAPRTEPHTATLNLQTLSWLTQFSAPSLAAHGLAAARGGDQAQVLGALLGMLGWAVGGAAAAYLVFVRMVLGDPESSRAGKASRVKSSSSAFDITRVLPFLPVEVLAVASKELRYLLRSLVGRFNLIMIVVFSALMALLITPQIPNLPLGIPVGVLGLYGMVAYTTLFSNAFIFNSLAWEGAGFQVYLVSSASPRRVILGKNLGIWIYVAALVLLSLLGWVILTGFPGARVILNSLLLGACVNVPFVMVGNFASFSFPVARSVSSLKSNPARTAVLISMGTLLAVAVPCVAALVVPLALNLPFLQPVCLLVLLAVTLGLYFYSLRFAVQAFEGQTEKISAALEGAP
jgi:hypothetical protein